MRIQRRRVLVTKNPLEKGKLPSNASPYLPLPLSLFLKHSNHDTYEQVLLLQRMGHYFKSHIKIWRSVLTVCSFVDQNDQKNPRGSRTQWGQHLTNPNVWPAKIIIIKSNRISSVCVSVLVCCTGQPLSNDYSFYVPNIRATVFSTCNMHEISQSIIVQSTRPSEGAYLEQIAKEMGPVQFFAQLYAEYHTICCLGD